MQMIKCFIILFLPLFCMACNEPTLSEEDPKEQFNLIVFFTDDHGYSDLSCQNVMGDVQTPNIDYLANNGVLMESGYVTAPQCTPSRAGLLSGRFQAKFGVESNGVDMTGFNQQQTIAERLKKAGYTTGMAGKWHLGSIHEIVDHGFDFAYHKHSAAKGWANYNFYGEYVPWAEQNTNLYHLEAVNKAACGFIDKNHDDPFFFYAAYRAPHVPMDAPQKYLDRFPGEMPERRRHALAMVSVIDDGVGMVLEKLREYGIEENTMIFLIGDNGAPLKITKEDIPVSFGGGAWDGSLNEPLNGEKGMLSEGGIRTPFVVYYKGKIQSGMVYEHPVSSLDVAATALALANLPENDSLDGVNLIPYLNGEKDTPPHETLCWRWISQSAIRKGDWKLLRGGEREYLYNLKEDKEELNNLYGQYPEKVAELKGDLVNWCDELQPPGLQTKDMAKTWNDYFDFYLDGIPYEE